MVFGEEGFGPGVHHGFFHGQPLRGMLAIAVLGLLESGLGLRRRIAPHGASIDG